MRVRIPLHGACNRFRRKRSCGCHNILLSAVSAATQELAHKFTAEFLPSRGLGRGSLEEIPTQESADDVIQYLSGTCNPPAAIEPLSKQLLGGGLDDHIAR